MVGKGKIQAMVQPELLAVRESVPCLECGARLESLSDMRAPSCLFGRGHSVDRGDYFRLYGMTPAGERIQ